MSYTIELLSPVQAQATLPDFVDLLCATVDDGASVGFLPPLSPQEAASYWQGVLTDLVHSKLLLWGARQDGRIVGTVQLHPVLKPNGSHRAEVTKLLVHPRSRRQGIARALMLALETEAVARRRITLVLDTRQGDPSELLYSDLGYVKAGVIPNYASNGEGTLDPTVFYYKLLG
jgi:acetyltransferase